MEFIAVKNKEHKIYTISNNLNNKYIIQFLKLYDVISSRTVDLIIFEVDSILTIKALPHKIRQRCGPIHF